MHLMFSGANVELRMEIKGIEFIPLFLEKAADDSFS